jgi:hypothetical protein
MLVTEPPSTRKLAPLMKLVRSEARKATMAATSCGSPGRFNSMCGQLLRQEGGHLLVVATPGLLGRRLDQAVHRGCHDEGGETALTRMPSAANALERLLVRLSRAAFEAL